MEDTKYSTVTYFRQRQLHCRKCGHGWIPRSKEGILPKRCPSCKCTNFNQPKKLGVGRPRKNRHSSAA